jgi:tRNA A-37 threonylcarbamoyl transferase component Bud32
MDNRTLLWQGLNMEGQTQLIAFRQNHVKLAWAFINIINTLHHFEILHNDLSNDNIMLHFLPDKPNFMYIGVYDLGEAEHLQEVMPSLYGFPKE